MTTSLSPLVELEPITDGCNRNTSPHHRKSKICVSTKIFCDPVHGQISLHPVCVAVIDTPQFQRLRHIKQTGFTEYVYHGSSHNRFGHSLGVCYLAGKFLQELKERQPELCISTTDILCVELAGLCHDLGHGPYSHTWEIFMKNSSAQRHEKKRWKHENVSANVFDYLIEENNLYPLLEEYGIGSKELSQVKDYILGGQPKNSSKAFLYQIINNDDSGLDVDKFDYFLRDCLHLGLPCSFEYERLMQYARVFYVDGKTQICFRDKTCESVYNVFRTRSNLHRLAYQHKVTIIIEKMFIDALLMADDEIEGPDKEIVHFWEWSMDAAFCQGEKLKSALEKYIMLTDDLVYNCLKFISTPHLKKASDLIKAIDRRSCKSIYFYQHVGLKILSQYRSEEEILAGICHFLPYAHKFMLSNGYEENGDVSLSEEEIFTDISDFLPDAHKCMISNGHEENSDVSPSDIIVSIVPVNWGKGAQNPVEFVHFYSKDNTYMRRCTEHLEVSVMLPKSYEEIQVHVLCRRSDNFALDVVRWCYDMYWKYSNAKNDRRL